jgi:hypothetical protein
MIVGREWVKGGAEINAPSYPQTVMKQIRARVPVPRKS